MEWTIANYTAASDDKKRICLKYYLWAMQNNLTSFRMVVADQHYYAKTLQQRRDLLGAPSIDYLCKTIIFENTAYDGRFAGSHYPQYIAVVVQYVARIHTEKLNKVMRVYQQSHATEKASKQFFHFRLAEEQVSNQLSGYEHNGVIPILMKTNMPLVMSDEIRKLGRQFFWMGGGHPDLKMRLSLAEFSRVYQDTLLVEDITYGQKQQ